MTTLLEAAKNLIAALDLDRHEVGDWPDDSRKAYNELKQAIADEKAKQQPTRTCKTCKFYAVSCHLYEPCLRCTHQAGISDQWEPKP